MNRKAFRERPAAKCGPKERVHKPEASATRKRGSHPTHTSRAWVSLISFSVLIACSHGIADSIPEEQELSGACDEYATMVGQCFGARKLAETTRKSLSPAGRSTDQVAALEKQCQTSLDNLRKSCK